MIGKTVLACCLVALTLPALSRAEAGSRPLAIHAGLHGYLVIDDGEPSAYLQATSDLIAGPGILVHYGIGLERKYSAYTRLVNCIGAGYLLQFGRLGIPISVHGGMTTTGLWGHRLHRPFLGAGSGFRLRFGKLLGIAFSTEAARYDPPTVEYRFLIGLLIMWNSRGTPID